DKYIELQGGTAEEPEVEIGGSIPPAPGAGIEKLLEGGGDLVADLSAIARSLKNILGRTEQGKGFLGALTSDSEESTRLGNSLDSIGRKLDSGQGTAGRLINDPAIFDAASHVVVGIDESTLLRWLIRNRQRAGIRKEYNETVRKRGSAAEPALENNPTPV